MAQRNIGIVGDQVLFGHIGDVMGPVVFREEVVEGLVLARAHFLRDRVIPFIGVRKLRIDVENHAPERKQLMAHHLSDLEPGFMAGNGVVEVVGIDRIRQQKRFCLRRAPPFTEDRFQPCGSAASTGHFHLLW